MSLFTAGDRTISLLAQVAVERSIDRYPDGLTYALPPHLADIRAGEQVRVPLGRGDACVDGMVVRTLRTDQAPGIPLEKLKFVESRSSAAPAMPGQLVELAQWISSYYVCPIGMTLASMTPSAVKRGVGTVTRTFVELSDDWETRLASTSRVSKQQKAVLEAMRALPVAARPVDIRDLAMHASLGTAEPIKRLVSAGILQSEERTSVEAAWRHHGNTLDTAPTLTAEQQGIVDAVNASLGSGFSQHLLFGVTGAGKTEVYMQLVAKTLAAGKTALVLVPEIALTPQTGGRLLARFPKERVAILHSGLSASQRNQQWMMVASGQARLVMGARSAIFAPIPDASLGLIVVDEEHDGSYKQDQMPRYHGRDVAIRRAQLAHCPVLMGSATPSLESWFNATVKKTSSLHVLRKRAPGLRLPQVEVVDFAAERKKFPDQRIHLLGPTLAGAIQETLDTGGQILILLNRRGYANWIACADHRCGWMMRCDRCDAGMICHKLPSVTGSNATQYVRCHHCLSEQRLPKSCPSCSKQVTVFGLGVQKVEEELSRLHPSLVAGSTMLRIDADSMDTAADFHDALGRFGSGEVRLLVGTQMIAKGLDFPGVRLVGVVSADTALNLPDFRATERTFQLVSQVSGRCGRSADAGRAIVQTFQPDAPAIKLAAAHDFESFAREELALREKFALPPWRRMARVVVRDAVEEKAREMSETLARELTEVASQSPQEDGSGSPVTVTGPMPCPIARIADRWRMQVEITATNAAMLGRFLTAARNSGVLRPGETFAVDVDPIALM